MAQGEDCSGAGSVGVSVSVADRSIGVGSFVGAGPVRVVVTGLLCWCRTNVLSVIVGDKGQ